MRKFSIYIEGYAATGEQGKARFLGTAEGETFEKACQNFVASGGFVEPHFYNKATNSYWSCRLYPSYEQAVKTFG